MSDSLWPHELQHTRPPCPSPTPGVYPDSCPLCWWCHPAISSWVVPFSSCPPIPPSIRVFSNESTLRLKWPKYWSFSFSITPSKEIPGLISFRMDWLDLLAVQGTLKSLLQHHIYVFMFFSFCLLNSTIGSGFIYLVRTDPNVFCLLDCTCVPQRWSPQFLQISVALTSWPFPSRFHLEHHSNFNHRVSLGSFRLRWFLRFPCLCWPRQFCRVLVKCL